MEKLSVKEVIVVEGRYDKNTLSQCVDATILSTEGFGIFRDKEKMVLLRRCAEERGLIVFTDSDGAGFVIRKRIRGAIPAKYLKHAYIPDVPGKEKRKKVGSREGTLGVEGMKPEVLIHALLAAGATVDSCEEHRGEEISKADFMALGLSGGENSSEKREILLNAWKLPKKLSSKGLLEAVNVLMTRQEFLAQAAALLQNGTEDHAQQQQTLGHNIKLTDQAKRVERQRRM